MSVEAMALVLHHSRATGTAKLVLLGIANHEGDGGAWPSVSTLAKYAGVHVRNVKQALRKLEQLNELHTVKQGGGMGDLADYERPNLYRVLVVCPASCDGTTKHKSRDRQTVLPGWSTRPAPDTTQPVDNGVTESSPGDASVTGGGDASVTRGVMPASPKPSSNHHHNQTGSASPALDDCGCVEGWLEDSAGLAVRCPAHKGKRRGTA